MVYFFSNLFLGTLFRSYIRNIKGIENIPSDFKFIIASNHSSYMDDFILPGVMMKVLNRPFHIFVNSRFYKNFLIRKILVYYGNIPVDVGKDVKDEQKRKETNKIAFDKALNYIKKGHIFAIFPEGGRSEDGTLKKAKTGVAKMALIAKRPVLPIGIKGTYKIMPKGAKYPKFKKADVFIGKPIDFSKYYGKEKDYKTLEKITSEIMKEIGKLIDMEYHY